MSATVRELEQICDFLRTRCTRYAEEVDRLNDILAKQAARIVDLEKTALPQEPDPQS